MKNYVLTQKTHKFKNPTLSFNVCVENKFF